MSAVLDISHLRVMTGDDAPLAAEALGIFRSQADVWGQLLDKGGSPNEWADACHAIKGAARSVGAMALGDVCETAEQLGRSGDCSEMQASVALGDVKDKLGATIEAIAVLEHRLAMSKGFPEA